MMSQRSDEVARYERVQKSEKWRVQWWNRVDAIAVLSGLMETAIEQDREAILLCERATKPNGEEVLWFHWGTKDELSGDRVRESPLVNDEAFNLSHPCPPCCPDCT